MRSYNQSSANQAQMRLEHKDALDDILYMYNTGRLSDVNYLQDPWHVKSNT